MNKYLVEFSASIGRKNMNVQAESDNGASMHSPVQLKYFGYVEAESLEAVNDKIVLYRDPGFVTSVTNIITIYDSSSKEKTALDVSALFKLMALDTLIEDIELMAQNSPKAKAQTK